MVCDVLYLRYAIDDTEYPEGVGAAAQSGEDVVGASLVDVAESLIDRNASEFNLNFTLVHAIKHERTDVGTFAFEDGAE